MSRTKITKYVFQSENFLPILFTSITNITKQNTENVCPADIRHVELHCLSFVIAAPFELFFLDTRNISPRTYLEKRNHIVFFSDPIFSPRIYPAPSRYLVSRILRHAWKYARNFQDFVS